MAEDIKEMPIFWNTIPKDREIKQNEFGEEFIFEATDPNGNIIQYELVKNNCPIVFKGNKFNNSFYLKVFVKEILPIIYKA